MKDRPKIIDPLFEMKAEEIVEYCEDRGKQFSEISTSQLRNVFSKIVSIRNYYNNANSKGEDPIQFFAKIKREITLLKPRLAYSASKLKSFHEEMTHLIDITTSSIDKELKKTTKVSYKLQTLDNFFTIIEGFVAYHKFYGGK